MSRVDGIAASASSPGERDATQRLIAVTRDGALAEALQKLASDVPILVVADLRQLGDAMLRQGSNLVLLDSAAVEEPLARIVDALTRQFPDLRLMVAGQAAEQNLLASRIANETVFRFIHKPASPQRLQLFLNAATRAGEHRRSDAASLAGAPPRPPSKLAFILAGLAAVCVAIAAAWLFWPEGAAARLNARDLAKVQDMMQRAEQATTAHRFASFDGTSSAELYRDVLQLDARNEQARTGLDRALNDAIGSARQALAAGRLDEATNGMEAVRLIAPTHPALQALVTDVQAETARQLADANARELMARRQQQIQAAVEQMTARIKAGALLDPESDNAILHFQAAQSVSAGDPAVRSARNQLTSALVAAGDNALQAKRSGEARRYADAASRINSSATGLAGLYWRIEEAATAAAAPPPRPASKLPSTTEMARALDAVVQTAPVVTAEPPVVAPTTAAPPAEPVWVPGEGVVSTSRLKTLRRGEAEYPNDAQVGQISGWVDLEFTVTTTGTVKDITVTESEPRRTFDNAAIRAMRNYRYEPVLKDGQPVEQRARLRMRFKFQDQ